MLLKLQKADYFHIAIIVIGLVLFVTNRESVTGLVVAFISGYGLCRNKMDQPIYKYIGNCSFVLAILLMAYGFYQTNYA